MILGYWFMKSLRVDSSFSHCCWIVCDGYNINPIAVGFIITAVTLGTPYEGTIDLAFT